MFASSKMFRAVTATVGLLTISLTGCTSSSTGSKQQSPDASIASPTYTAPTPRTLSARPVEDVGGYPPKDLCSNKLGVQSKVPAGLTLVVLTAVLVDPTLPTDITTECIKPSVVKQRVAQREAYEREARRHFDQEYMSQANVQQTQGVDRLDRIMDYFCESKGGKEAFYRMVPAEEAYDLYRATHRVGLESGWNGEFYQQAREKCLGQIEASLTYKNLPAATELHTVDPEVN